MRVSTAAGRKIQFHARHGFLDSQDLQVGTESDNADLYVCYQCAIDQEKQWDAYNMGGVGCRFGGGMTEATSSTINVGPLAVDFYNPAEKQLVWRGTATKTLEPSKGPQKNEEKQKNSIGLWPSC